jgi:P27 family predicted phage terminase small subunit
LKKSASLKIPKGLSVDAKTWWKRLHDEFDLEDEGAAFLLESAIRSFDRMNQAAELVEKHGVCTLDRYQQLKPNPAVAAERDARAAMLSAFKALNLDVIPTRAGPGRPAGAGIS